MTADVVLPWVSDGWRLTHCMSMFQDCIYIVNDNGQLDALSHIDFSNVIYTTSMFSGCIELLKVPYFDTSHVIHSSYMFATCRALIFIPSYDFSNNTSLYDMFGGCISLIDCTIQNIGIDVRFSVCGKLTRESIISMFNGLKVVSSQQRFDLETNVLAQLSAEDIKIATDKGWIVY